MQDLENRINGFLDFIIEAPEWALSKILTFGLPIDERTISDKLSYILDCTEILEIQQIVDEGLVKKSHLAFQKIMEDEGFNQYFLQPSLKKEMISNALARLPNDTIEKKSEQDFQKYLTAFSNAVYCVLKQNQDLLEKAKRLSSDERAVYINSTQEQSQSDKLMQFIHTHLATYLLLSYCLEREKAKMS